MADDGSTGDSEGTAGVDRPMRFIDWDEDTEKFAVNAEAARYLSTITTPVAVVAVAGKYRTGKSYLLNLLMDRSSGFEVGPTVVACTKGIWLWGKGVKVEGRDVTILFFDTEGLDSTDRDSTFDSRLFALTLLLCSTFVFNATGSINGEEINKLSLVVNLTRVIHTKRHGGREDSGKDYSTFFPHFIYLIRDFMLELERDGVPLTPNEYLEDALEPEETLEDDGLARNDIRDAVRSFFPKRDCFTLVRPVSDEEKLSDLSKVPYGELREEFRHGLEAMKRRLFHSLEAKHVYGRPLNGGMLASLASAYVEALNDSGTPVISSAWDMVVAAQCERAVEEGVSAYNNVVKAALRGEGGGAGAGASEGGAGAGAGSGSSDTGGVLDEPQLQDAHERGLDAARQAFRAIAVQDESAAEYEVELEQQVRAAHQGYQSLNASASEAACEALIVELLKKHHATLQAIGTSSTASAAVVSSSDDSDDSDDDSTSDDDDDDDDDDSSVSSLEFATSSDDEDAAAERAARAKARADAKARAKAKAAARAKARAAKRKAKPPKPPSGATRRARRHDSAANNFCLNATELFWNLVASIRRDYEDKARGPSKPQVLLQFLSERVPELQNQVMERAQAFVDSQFKTLEATISSQVKDLATARGASQALADESAQQKAAFEHQLTEAALKASQERERVREAIEAKDQELQRSIRQFDSFMKTQTARGEKDAGDLKAAREEVARLRTQVDEVRDRLEAKMEESLKLATEASRANAALARAERELSETREAMAGDEADSARLLTKLAASETEISDVRENAALLREAATETRKRLRAQEERIEEIEYKLAENKAKLAQAEGEKLQLMEDRFSYEHLAAQMKVIMAKKNTLKYLKLDAMSRRRFDTLPLPEA